MNWKSSRWMKSITFFGKYYAFAEMGLYVTWYTTLWFVLQSILCYAFALSTLVPMFVDWSAGSVAPLLESSRNLRDTFI